MFVGDWRKIKIHDTVCERNSSLCFMFYNPLLTLEMGPECAFCPNILAYFSPCSIFLCSAFSFNSYLCSQECGAISVLFADFRSYSQKIAPSSPWIISHLWPHSIWCCYSCNEVSRLHPLEFLLPDCMHFMLGLFDLIWAFRIRFLQSMLSSSELDFPEKSLLCVVIFWRRNMTGI